MFRVGPFRIVRVLGSGGMGKVWEGVHEAHDFPVAVKILDPGVAHDARFLAYFRNEVRAVAGLSHPHIVDVYDHGQIDAEAETASGGLLTEGSPWLAMELASEGSLSQWYGRLEWSELKKTLLALLDALAHAHARGVLHRDLKGGNVLLAGAGRRVKLADFGLAHATAEPIEDPEEQGRRVMGTPWFMAPEQFAGTRRDQGPWTDLYALGCLAWALATGSPPFPGRGWTETRAAHLTAELPTLEPAGPVPEAFEAWLQTLLEKPPHRRFPCAADAAWALHQLGDAAGSTTAVRPFGRPEPTSGHTLSFDTADGWFQDDLPIPAPGPRGRRWPAAPFPIDWRERARDRVHPAPPGVGIGLYGLRNIPVVGRDAERDALWSALRRVRTEGRTVAASLVGSAGAGKTRLARWLCERASEVGGAAVLRATHGASAGVGDGIGPMVARHFRCAGIDRATVAEHLWNELTALRLDDGDDWKALVEICSPPIDPTLPSVRRFESAAERYAVLHRLLARLCEDRPVIVWLDDAPRGLDALALVQFFLDLPRFDQIPVLFVLTVRAEDLPDHPIAEIQLDEIHRRSDAVRVEVPPLAPEHRSELVRTLLGLDADLSQRIEERTGGNPLFAVQLVGDLVHRGVLVPGERGFRLQTGAQVELPQDIQGVWRERVERVLASRSPAERVALELAAALGQEVDALEWHAVCLRVGVTPSDDLVEALLSQRLARAWPGGPAFGWSFVHGMLRESIEQTAKARDERRWRGYHAACAAVVAQLGDPQMAARLGRHQIAAGEPDKAIATLLAAARSRDLDPRVAEGLLLEHARSADLLGLPEDDRRRVEGWLLRAEILLRQGREQDAAQWGSRALHVAEEASWDDLSAAAYHCLAEVARLKRRFGPSLQFRQKAVRHARKAGDVERLADATAGIGRLYLDVGNWSQAEQAYAEAFEVARVHDLDALAADCLTSLGYIAVKTGREAEAPFAEAGEYVRRSGSRVQHAHLLNALADLARKRGAFADAEAHTREALAYYRAAGTRAARVMLLNLSLFQVLQGRYEAARATLDEAMQEDVKGPESQPYVAGCLAVLLPCLAATKEWEGWYRHLETIGRTFSGDMFVDDDTMAMLELGASLARESGERERAAAAYVLVLRLWKAMGREEEVRRIEEAVGVG